MGAGTGLLGAEAAKHGYDSIDGLDSSLGMLAQVYNFIHDSLDGLDSSLGIRVSTEVLFLLPAEYGIF